VKRKVDELGRIVLPAEYRNALNVKEKDEVNLSLGAGMITIKKPILGCHFCNSAVNLVRIGGETVCKSCIQRLYEAKDDDVILPIKID
jgi:transcriptional pleiotropic regulator of transition state genes